MKIELDLDEILGGEESIREHVIQLISNDVKTGLKKRLDSEVAKAITQGLTEAIASKMPELVSAVIETPYVPVDRWGDRNFGSEPTTFRAQIVKAINEQMVYKHDTYGRGNAFTQAVDAVVAKNVTAFKAEFNKLVHATFTQETFEYATAQLKKKLGVA